eukprot:TRINITY_DN18620_c0_g1_i2.p1 TRINITY_DN18620_c0_g1~~TRINITY_DN18620_c0_g1_i2.p1  ORF type:complete len:1550 (+),score=362.90 TRINITY_DN18620_c0_g1_i2:50-4651(+)
MLQICWISWCRIAETSCLEAAAEKRKQRFAKQEERYVRSLMAWSMTAESALRVYCFTAWSHHVQENTETRKSAFEKSSLATSAVASMSHASAITSLRICWISWCRITENSCMQKAVERSNQTFLRQEESYVRSLMVWSMTAESALRANCFTAWSRHVQECKQVRQAAYDKSALAASAFASMSHASAVTTLQSCWIYWSHITETSRLEAAAEKRLVLDSRDCLASNAASALASMSHATAATTLHICWMSWSRITETSRLEAAAEKRKQRFVKQEERYARSLMAWSLTAETALRATCFTAWNRHVQECKQLRQAAYDKSALAASALASMSHATAATTLHICWMSWSRITETSRLEAAAEKRKQRFVKQEERYARSLMAWCFSAETALRANCFTAWSHHVQDSAKTRKAALEKSSLALSAVASMSHASAVATLQICLVSWCHTVETSCLEAAAEKRKRRFVRQEESYVRTLMMYAAMADSALQTSFFTAWCRHVQEAKHRRSVEVRVESQSARLSMTSQALSALSARKEELILKSMCWTTWNQSNAESRAAQEAQVMQRQNKETWIRALMAADAPIGEHLCRSCFVAWSKLLRAHQEQMQAQMKNIIVVNLALSKLLEMTDSLLLSKTWSLWSQSFVLHMKNSRLEARWRQMQSQKRELRIHALMASSASYLLLSCFEAWVKSYKEHKDRAEQLRAQMHKLSVASSALSKILEMSDSLLLSKTWSSWSQSFVLHMKSKLEARWQQVQSENKATKLNLVLAFSTSLDGHVGHNCFLAWRSTFQRQKERLREHRKILANFAASSDQLLKQTCLIAWVSQVRDKERCRQQRVACLQVFEAALDNVPSDRQLLLQSFLIWQRRANTMKAETHSQELRCQLRDMCLRTILVDAMSTHLKCFLAWATSWQSSRAWHQERQRRRLLIEPLSSMTLTSIPSRIWFCSWMQVVQGEQLQTTKREQQARWKRALTTWNDRSEQVLKSTCFSSWLAQVMDAKRRREAELEARLRQSVISHGVLELAKRKASDTAYVMMLWQRATKATLQTRLETFAFFCWRRTWRMELMQACMMEWQRCTKARILQHKAEVSRVLRRDSLERSCFALAASCGEAFARLCISAWRSVHERRLGAKRSALLSAQRQRLSRALDCFIDDCYCSQLRCCFGAWSREAQEAAGKARRSELAVEALASFCREGRDVLLDTPKLPEGQRRTRGYELAELPSRTQVSPRLVEVALKGCANVEHLQQLQQQTETLAWRCASDLAEIIGDREARYQPADLTVVPATMPTPQNSMGRAAVALAEAYQVETRRLLRVHGRLVEELQPMVDEVRSGMDDVLGDAKQLLAMLLPDAPPRVAALPAEVRRLRRSQQTDGADTVLLSQVSKPLHETPQTAEQFKRRAGTPRPPKRDTDASSKRSHATESSSLKQSITEAFRTLQAGLPSLRQRKGQEAETVTDEGASLRQRFETMKREGASAEAQQPAACLTCGNIFMPDAVFCRRCGQKRVQISMPLTGMTEGDSPRGEAGVDRDVLSDASVRSFRTADGDG